jgi:capsule polysaccharide export protein KpsE/RkpR
MNAPAKQPFNLFSYLKLIKPYWRKLLRSWYIPVAFSVLLGLYKWYNERQNEPFFTAQITYMLEDEILNGAPAANPLMAAITGQSPTSNKAIMNDLAFSNLLIEYTLLRNTSANGRYMPLINHLLEKQGVDSTNPAWFKSEYKIGDNPSKDEMLRSFSNGIKLTFKAMSKESGLLVMSFSNSDAFFCKRFLEQHLHTISDFYIDKRMDRANMIIKAATRRRDSLLAALQGKEYNSASMQDQGFGTVMRRASVPQTQLQRDINMLNAQYGESLAALNAAKMELEKKRPFIAVVDDIRFPLEATYPEPYKKGAIFGIIGLFLGIAVVVGFHLAKEMLVKQKQAFRKLNS